MITTILLGLLALAPTAEAAPVADVVDHVATLQGDSLSWDSRVRVSGEQETETVLPLAVPLGPELLVESDHELVVQDGQVVGVRLPPRHGRISLRVTQPAPGGRADLLALPLFAGDAINRIDLDGVRYTPDPSLGLEARMRNTVTPGINQQDRRQVDKRLDGHVGPKGSRLYVIAEPGLVQHGGLVGEVTPAGEVSVKVVVGVASLFALLLVSGFVGYRLLDTAARKERLEQYMSDEFVRKELARGGGPGSQEVSAVPTA